VLRSRQTGAALRTCGFYAGPAASSYTNKCGFSGRNWHAVRINAVNELGWRVTVGYIPTTCARVR
jgi:hypothetical protein